MTTKAKRDMLWEARPVARVFELYEIERVVERAGLRVVLELWGSWPCTAPGGQPDPMAARSDGQPRIGVFVPRAELELRTQYRRADFRLFPERLWRDPSEARLYSGVAVLRELREDEP